MELLTASQIRVLGALIEKALTTPDYYPLTLNSLTAACNQKSNRNPVVSYDEKTVVRALESLREASLAARIVSDDARVPKYKHNFAAALHLNMPELSVLGVLMLRGAQTVGEIRTRTKRMHNFNNLLEVEEVLRELAERAESPLVKQLPRQAGLKESRYAHLLAGEPEEEPVGPARSTTLEPVAQEVAQERQRLDQLEAETKALREELDAMRAEFSEFKKQFE